MRFLPALPVLLAAACTGQPGNAAMSETAFECALSASGQPGVTSEEACAFFAAALEDAGAEGIARLELSAPTARSMNAAAYDSDGNILLEMQMDVSDSAMTAAMWRTFAQDFARQLTA